ncbi:MAG: beta-L-arabinofuranosidase domain-containing protein, partial [Bacteroidota bacterium]
VVIKAIFDDWADGYLGSSDAENKWAGADAAEIRQNMAGLLAYHELTGYKPALDICKRSGDLLIATYGDGKRDIITAGTPGESGLASTAVLSPMTDLYRLTGEAKYLEFCKYITHAYEAANGPHLLTRPNAVGKSADLLANLNGLAKLYVLTGDAQYLKAATADHKDLTENFLSITGSADPADEACTVSEWAELNTRLFSLTGELHYMDLFERAAYNGLAASASPSTGCAHIKSSEAGSKTYSCLPSAQLAASAGAILQVPGMVTGLKDGGAAILAYTNFSDRITLVEGPKPVTLTLTMTSRFPDDGMKTMLIMQPSKPMEFSVWLRVPNWCSSFKVSMIGGKNAREGKPGEWLEFKEEWKRGDKLYIDFDIPVSLTDAGPKNAGMAAVVRGPQVLAADSVLNKAFRLDDASVLSAPFMPADESEKKEKDKKPKPGGYRPQVPSGPVRLLRAAFPAGWEGGQAYSVSGNAAGKNTDIVLVPYAEAGQSGSQSQLWFKKQ